MKVNSKNFSVRWTEVDFHVAFQVWNTADQEKYEQILILQVRSVYLSSRSPRAQPQNIGLHSPVFARQVSSPLPRSQPHSPRSPSDPQPARLSSGPETVSGQTRVESLPPVHVRGSLWHQHRGCLRVPSSPEGALEVQRPRWPQLRDLGTPAPFQRGTTMPLRRATERFPSIPRSYIRPSLQGGVSGCNLEAFHGSQLLFQRGAAEAKIF